AANGIPGQRQLQRDRDRDRDQDGRGLHRPSPDLPDLAAPALTGLSRTMSTTSICEKSTDGRTATVHSPDARRSARSPVPTTNPRGNGPSGPDVSPRSPPLTSEPFGTSSTRSGGSPDPPSTMPPAPERSNTTAAAALRPVRSCTCAACSSGRL